MKITSLDVFAYRLPLLAALQESQVHLAGKFQGPQACPGDIE